MAFRKLFEPGTKVTFAANADITSPGFVKIAGDRAIAIADPETDQVIGAIEVPDRDGWTVKAGELIAVTLDASVWLVPVATAVAAGDIYGTAGVVIRGAAAGDEAEIALTRSAVTA